MHRLVAILLGLSFGVALIGAPAPTYAQKRPKREKAATAAPAPAAERARPRKARVFDFGAMSFEGTMRTPQLLYFLGRVKQELDRASLEKRSFMPELVRTVDEGGL